MIITIIDRIQCLVQRREKCDEINHFHAIACVGCGENFGRKLGRPQKTTQNDGFSVGHNGGRPRGTTRQAGNGVSGGRPRNSRRCPEFNNTIQLLLIGIIQIIW